jgi:hypothetical protein
MGYLQRIALLVSISCLILSCVGNDTATDYSDFNFDFSLDDHDWQSFFADYPAHEESFFELDFGWKNQPLPLDTTVKTLMISGNNHSDDLFMGIYRKVENLIPGAVYKVTFEISMASNVATGSVGVGGSPDLSLGVGGMYYQPDTLRDNDGWYRPNFMSLLQSHESNSTLKVAGTIGVSDTTTQYTVIHRDNLDAPMNLKVSNQGELYLMIAVDSGFEGITKLYFKSVHIRLEYWAQ